MNQDILGIHHVTAITRDIRQNTDFYTRVLGLRLVKRTMNFNDAQVEHLFYGNWSGEPGTLMTFFAWPEGEAGRVGAGAVGEVAFAIPRASLAFWIGHLIQQGVRYSGPSPRFGEQVLTLRDSDGMMIDLVAGAEADQAPGWSGGSVPAEHAIRGLHHVTLWESAPVATSRLLMERLGFRAVAEHDGVTRYALSNGGLGRLVHVRDVAGFWPAASGVGTVHHVAWRAADIRKVQAWHDALSADGLTVTPLIDRRYFQSIYFQEPGGVIFEIATDGPGFTVDEPIEQLGTQVQQAPDAGSEWSALAQPLGEPAFDQEALKGEQTMIHQFIPATADGAPTLLLLHGTGGNEHDLLELGRNVAPHAALLSPRGQVLENGMPRFFRRLAEGVFDLDDLRRRTGELAAFVTDASMTYGFDPHRVIAVGYSNGANIAASLMLLHPQVLAGAVLFHAMVPLIPEQAPDLRGVPVFMGSGRADPLIPAPQSEELARLLRDAGADVELHWQPGGHALNRAEVQAATLWMRAHVQEAT